MTNSPTHALVRTVARTYAEHYFRKNITVSMGLALHVLVAPAKHYVSILEMPKDVYTTWKLAMREVQDFYLSKGYGPAVTELRLEPGPHTPHVHGHLVFSSNSLRPLRPRNKKEKVEERTD